MPNSLQVFVWPFNHSSGGGLCFQVFPDSFSWRLLAQLGLLAGLLAGLWAPERAGAQGTGFFSRMEFTDKLTIRNDQGQPMSAAWAGGFTSPQFSNIDFNQDGVADLFVFERYASVVTPLVNVGGTQFRYAPEYRTPFPEDSMNHFALLRDYDNDGHPDVFTINPYRNRFQIYQNLTGQLGSLRFRQENPDIYTLTAPGLFFPMGIVNSDLIGIEDVDYDGDLDVLVERGGGILVLHKNMALEKYGTLDTTELALASDCFGHFLEFYDSQVDSYYAQLQTRFCPNEFKRSQSNKTAHSGMTICGLNVNGDTLMDFILGDFDVPYMLSVVNGGTRRIADMVAAESPYPTRYPINGNWEFPAAYHVRVNADAHRDLLVAPNSRSSSADQDMIWHYENIGRDDSAQFDIRSTSFLGDQVLDLGTGAYPCVFDYNQDGKQDLLVGITSRYYSPTKLYAGIYLFENQGTQAQPEFTLVDTNYLGLASLPSIGFDGAFCPTVGDVNGDSLPDIVVGDNGGRLYYFENTSTNLTPGAPYELSLQTFDFLQFATQENRIQSMPHLVDVDGDGDDDLLVGCFRAETPLYFYRNDNVNNEIRFTLIDRNWGGVYGNTRDSSYDATVSPLVLDVTADSTPELILGVESGYLKVHGGLSPDSTTRFPHLGWLMDSLSFGNRPHPAVYGYPNQDSIVYLIIGNRRGGLHALEMATGVLDTTQNDTDTLVINRPEVDPELPVRVYPNPSSQTFRIAGPQSATGVLLDLTGRVLLQGLPTETPIDASQLPEGVYLIRVTDGQRVGFTRLHVQRP